MDGNRTIPQFNQTFAMHTEQWGWYVKMTSTHLIVLVGLLANCVTFILMRSPRLRYKSYSNYLSALAYFDSLVLIFQEIDVINQMLTSEFGQPGVFEGFSDAACKIYQYFDTVCNLMSSWLIVTMAIERMSVVYMPFRRNIWCKQRGAFIIILALFIFLACSQIFRLQMVHKGDNICLAERKHDSLYMLLHIYVYQFTLLFILPVVIVVFCNIAVLLKIFRVEKATHNTESTNFGLTNGASNRRNKTTRLMIAISLTYIVTALPLIVLTIVIFTLGKMYGLAAGHHLVASMPWFNFLQTVANLNYASNFFIYILSGKKFRIELRRIFKKNHRNNNSMNGFGSSRTREDMLLMNQSAI